MIGGGKDVKSQLRQWKKYKIYLLNVWHLIEPKYYGLSTHALQQFHSHPLDKYEG